MTQPVIIAEPSPPVIVNENGLIVEQTPDGEWSYDPNEPRYCICNQVSYGDMVACDNEAVSILILLEQIVSLSGNIHIYYLYTL